MIEDVSIKIENKWYKLKESEKNPEVEKVKKILGTDMDSKIMTAINLTEEEIPNFMQELRLEEYQKLLNPKGQDKMMSLSEFCIANADIPIQIILDTLIKLKYVYKYYIKENGEKVCCLEVQKPFTYLSIIPVYIFKIYNVCLKKEIVIADEVITTLKKECIKEFERINKLKNIRKIK